MYFLKKNKYYIKFHLGTYSDNGYNSFRVHLYLIFQIYVSDITYVTYVRTFHRNKMTLQQLNEDFWAKSHHSFNNNFIINFYNFCPNFSYLFHLINNFHVNATLTLGHCW